MSGIGKTISENLISLRKNFKLTQIELASQLGYSDKAISRWEKGEVTPDVETLERLANLYGVPIHYFFEKHNKTNNRTLHNNIVIYEILSIAVIWTVVTVVYTYINWNQGLSVWPIFVLGVPCSAGCIVYFNEKYFHNPSWFAAGMSISFWTLITSIFCFLNFQEYVKGSWIFFILGVPIQAIIISVYFLKKNK